MSAPFTPLNQPESLDSLTPEKTKQILEAALLTTQEPLPASELRKLFNHELSAALLSKITGRNPREMV